MAKIQINGMDFEPRTDCNYKNAYVDWINMAEDTEELLRRFPQVPAENLTKDNFLKTLLRQWVLTDLWFVVYFVLGIKSANHPFVVNLCRMMEEGPKTKTMDIISRGHFKALAIDTPILTTAGWKNHGDLKIGDRIFGSGGAITTIIAKTEVFTNSDCYEVAFNNGSSIVANGDHIWAVEVAQSNGRKTALHTTRDMADMELKRWKSAPPLLAVKIAETLKTATKNLIIDPYILGYWLGDGTSTSSNITVGGEDIQNITSTLSMRGFPYRVRKKSGTTNVTLIVNPDDATGALCRRGHEKNGLLQCPECRKLNYRHSYYGEPLEAPDTLAERLRRLGVLGNKHIPLDYMLAAPEQRLALLQGLMDTDGTMHGSSSTAYFINKNFKLSKGVFDLATSLGLKATIKQVERRATNSPTGEIGTYWLVTFQAYTEVPVFRLHRKLKRCISMRGPMKWRYHYIKSIRRVPTVPTSCIQVDAADGIYLAGPHLIPTHNSTIITKAETLSYHLANPECCTIIFSYKKPLAETFLKSIKQCFESAFLKELFPDVLYSNPDKESSSWSVQNGITVKRKNKSRSEPTVYASGLTEGMATGFHVERRIFDDIEVGDMAGSADVMNDVYEKFALSSFLGTKGDDDIERIVGTFYHHSGPLARIKEIKKADGTPMYNTRIIPGTDDGQPNGKPVFWSQEVLDMEKPLPGFYSQILCDPTPRTARKLNPEFMHSIPYNKIPRNLYRFLIIDPAGSEGGGNPWAIMLIGVQPKRDDVGASNVYILDACVTKMGQTAAIEEICRMYINGGTILKIGVEKVGQSTAEIHVANALNAMGRRISVENESLVILKPSGRKKQDRIESALEWPLNNQKLFISDTVPKKYSDHIRQEMNKFPYGSDDAIDALSYVYDIIKEYRFPQTEEQRIWSRTVPASASSAGY